MVSRIKDMFFNISICHKYRNTRVVLVCLGDLRVRISDESNNIYREYCNAMAYLLSNHKRIFSILEWARYI